VLQLHIKGTDESGVVLFDEQTNKFITAKSRTIQLEHSLISISKWESKWKVPFIGTQLTHEQTIDYIRCMTLNSGVDENLYACVSDENVRAVQQYITDEKTATWFREDKDKKQDYKVLTSERIYSWMVVLNIPFECEKWHLSRLMILIKAVGELNAPPKKRSRAESAAYYRAQHAARRKRRGR
jgi:hypothetical protein